MQAWIGLGSNLGERRASLGLAARMIDALDQVEVLAASSLYLSEPWGITDQPQFFNAVIQVESGLGPEQLLVQLQLIEDTMGRLRQKHRWGPRVIDLDLLLMGETVLDTPGLTLPHPRIHMRAFVLVPLLELAPDMVIPGQGAASDLLADLEGPLPVCEGAFSWRSNES